MKAIDEQVFCGEFGSLQGSNHAARDVSIICSYCLNMLLLVVNLTVLSFFVNQVFSIYLVLLILL